MDIVFEPSFLFISDGEWSDEELRDLFLENFLEVLSYVDKIDNMKICWNSELEASLWEEPCKAPWRIDKDFRVPLVNIISQLFRKNMDYLDQSLEIGGCQIMPQIYEDPNPAQFSFLKLMHYLTIINKQVFLAIDEKYRNDYTFYCCCHDNKLVPLTVTNLSDVIKLEDIISQFWPKCKGDHDSFNILLVLYAKMNNCFNFRRKYRFTDSFIKILCDETNRKEKILECLTLRLNLTEYEAGQNPMLQDEYIRQVNERRFRITPRPSSNRVHYIYDEDGTICFLKYYGDGEHDVGLS